MCTPRQHRLANPATVPQEQSGVNHARNPRWIVVAVAVALVLASAIATVSPAHAQTYQVIHNFTGGQDGANPEAGLSMDRAGNLYGTAYQGGSANRGTVFKFTYKSTGWVLSPLYSFTGEPDGSSPTARVIVGPDGSLYGTTEFGGHYCLVGCGTVFSLKPPVTLCKSIICSWSETILYRFHGDSDGANPGYGDLAFDSQGHIYGTTYFGGNDANGVVYELTSSNGSWTESAIYLFRASTDGQYPYSGVVLDSSGNLYGTTFAAGAHGYGNVFQLTHSGSGWSANSLYAFHDSTDGGKPFGGVIFDDAGNLYGSTSTGGTGSGGTVYELAANTWGYDLLYSLSGSAYLPGSYASLTRDAAGNLYGTTNKDGAYGAGSVFKLTPSGGGWMETDLYDFPGGVEGAVPFGSVLIDASGNLYGTASQGGTSGFGVIWEITPQ